MNAHRLTPAPVHKHRGAAALGGFLLSGALALFGAGSARGQGLLDVTAAGAAAGSLEGTSTGAARRQGDSVVRGAEEATARGAARTEARASAAAAEGGAPASGDSAGGREAGGGAGGEKRKGLIFYDQLGGGGGNDSGGDDLTAPSGDPVPETYIVAKGDTLWSICSRFFSNPYFWPKLWSYNEMITNPHWIYPGDLISMYPPGQGPQKPTEAEPKEEKSQMRSTIQRRGPAAPRGVVLSQNGFVEPGELDVAGRISGSKEEKMLLSTGDEVYIETSKRQPFKVGQSYTIYKVQRPVQRQTGRREVLGNIVEIIGQVGVLQVTNAGIARAIIREAVSPIERGFRVGPLRRTFKQVDPKNNRGNVEGNVIASLQPTSLVGVEQLIFVDLGRSSGLEAGNRLFVVRRGDGVLKVLGTDPVDDRRYPREVVAEIIVVDVRDRTSAGLVMRQTKEIRIGDRVEGRKGY